MNKLQELSKTLEDNTLVIYDSTAIYYLTGYRYDVGERMIALVLKPNHTPTLFLNKLFAIPENLNTIVFEDQDNPTTKLDDYLPNGLIYIEGNLPARFLLPLINDKRTFKDGSFFIEKMRQIKSAEEIKILQEASHHNDRIMSEMQALIQEGMSESYLAKIVKEKQSTPPLSGPSFEPIVVFSENIADPHGIPSNRQLKKGDAILIDMGGMYQNYASDMTRTFFFGSNPKLEELYDIVLEANIKAIEAIKVGNPISSIDKAARDVITQKGYGAYFIHRTGHGVGLEVHETLDISSTNHNPIEVGMVFSIEPGIYIEGLGGIRVEDLVAITSDGIVVLNKHPKEKTYL